MDGHRSTYINVAFSPDLLARVDEIAKSLGLSRSAYIRFAMVRDIRRSDNTKPRAGHSEDPELEEVLRNFAEEESD